VKNLAGLLRGFPGHPSHPPFTDVTIGTFTLGTVLATISWLGISERETVDGALLAIVVGLVLSLPTVATGFLDYLDIPRGVARWRLASLHWLAMLTAVAFFLVAAALLQDDFERGQAGAVAALTAIGAELVLVIGGWLGGTMVFVYGERVLSRPQAATAHGVLPRLIEREPVPERDAPEDRRE
jgi:uncharacterized membrane protein